MEPRMYKSGDVVWVLASKRLGWWPGRVENVEELRQELVGDVTDKTIAVVKFLNEDNYQFVEDETIICAYESNRKQEYISLGMKKYFEKKRLNETSSTFMKFPNDVRQAEELIGGNPDIVDDEQFQPKKVVPAQSKYKNIFVDPRVKEVKVKSPVKGAGSPRRPGRPSAAAKDVSPTTKVNHPRFQGQSDHEVRIRRQEKSPAAGSPGLGEYRCDSCAFQTSRLNLMVIHKKNHLSSPSTATAQQNAAQKRPSSPPKKTHSKRSKKNTEPDGDLFDQVKRNLEAKEVGSKASPQPRITKTTSSPKTPKTVKTPQTPKLPRTPRAAKSPATATAVKTPTVKASDTKTQFNPKKKWLKSLQKEANPEVKNKLMADWEEDEEDEKEKQPEQQQREETTPPTENNKDTPVESDSDHEHRPSKSTSDLLHQRSDDEDDDDAMETETVNPKSPDKLEKEEDQETTGTEESLAGISAEIDKLNADLDATNHETRSSKINGEPEPVSSLLATKEADPTVVNGVKTPTCNPPSKCDEEIKQDVASLLAETSVPSLPDITGLGKVSESLVQKVDPPVEVMNQGEEEKMTEDAAEASVAKEVEAVTENGVEAVAENGVATVTVTENGVETEMETTNGGSNILMQVEGGETYMVVWEPGSNIQEFLACGGEGEDGSAGTTQTLLIDPSSLQAGSDLENLFQMAVAASAAPQQQNEQSNSTTSSSSKKEVQREGRRSTKGTPGNKSKLTVAEELLKRRGDAVNQDLAQNTLVWSCVNPHLFVPGAVIDSSDRKTLTLAAFDVDRPNNQRKYQRNRVIAAFHHELNLELLTFGRAKNKAAIGAKLNQSYYHANSFSELRSSTNLAQLTVRQYLTSCNRSPAKLFSERYLTSSPLDEIPDLPELLDDSNSTDELTEGTEEHERRLQIVETMLDQHVLTDSCLQHLADFVKMPSERLNLYESGSWNKLSRSATSGILETSRELYSKLADFLTENVHRVRELQEGKDHKRVFILDFLLPEALIYGVQKMFQVTIQEAHRMVIYGLKSHDKPV